MLEPPSWVTEDQGFSASIAQQPQKSNKKPITLYPWSDLQMVERRKYLIKGLCDEGSMSVVYGESNSGKTFFALDLAAHISMGWGWRGRRVRKGKVLYIASEGGFGVGERLVAFATHHEIAKHGDLFLAPQTIILSGENNDCDHLIAKIREVGEVSLVIVDTLARAMAGGDENSSGDMGFFIRCCDKIREETGAHVMVIHHSGKDQNKGARGHSSLRAAIDTEIQVSQDKGIVTAKVLKQRDGRIGDDFSFNLTVVELGFDDDGDAITSCVLVPTERQASKNKKSPSPQARRALDILRNCLIDKGQKRHVRSGMVFVSCVTLDEYRDYLKRERISASDNPASENKAITRSIDTLNDLRLTCSYGEYKALPSVFVTEKGFCIDPKTQPYSGFNGWKEEHKFNENISSLLPWITYVIFQTIEACSEIMLAFAQNIRFPDEIAPDHRVFIRDHVNNTLLDLLKVSGGELIWWEAPAEQPTSSTPSNMDGVI